RRLPPADERKLALDIRNRLLDNPEALLLARVAFPAAPQRSTRLLRLGELDELFERQSEQVAQPDQLLQAADVRIGIRPVRALLAPRARPEQPELLVVADRARGHAHLLRDVSDAQRAHAAASSMSKGSIATASVCTYFPPRMSDAKAATTQATIAKMKA